MSCSCRPGGRLFIYEPPLYWFLPCNMHLELHFLPSTPGTLDYHQIGTTSGYLRPTGVPLRYGIGGRLFPLGFPRFIQTLSSSWGWVSWAKNLSAVLPPLPPIIFPRLCSTGLVKPGQIQQLGRGKDSTIRKVANRLHNSQRCGLHPKDGRRGSEHTLYMSN